MGFLSQSRTGTLSLDWSHHLPARDEEKDLFEKGKKKDINYYVCFWKNILPDAIVSTERSLQSILLERGSGILRLE